MTTTSPSPALAQDRQDTILSAAFRAFATYGFRRTSMDDIARGAGLSRTALYVYYRNKEDIFRTLTMRYVETAVADMAAALAQPGLSTEQALLAALRAKDGALMEIVLTSPHGRELLEAAFATSADVASAGEVRLTKLIAEWLGKLQFAEDLGTPGDVAQTIMASAKGLKVTATSLEDYRSSQARLARIFARALTT